MRTQAAGDPLDALVAEVLRSSKYRRVCEEAIRGIGARELAAHRNLKAAIKATKNKLHQIGGVTLNSRMDYAGALALLREANGDRERLRSACRAIMARHASTRERLPILEQFYARTLADVRPIRSVIDVACGLNPLAILWMPLAEGARYAAYDIYTDLTDFVREALALMGIPAQIEARDVTQSLPDQEADLALLLKAIPCLEQIDGSAGQRVLTGIRARRVLVSFPARSLGGYHKGMVENYEEHFMTLVEPGWRIRRFEFASELVFLVTKGSP